MPADPTTPIEQRISWSIRLPLVVVLLALFAASGPSSANAAMAGHDPIRAGDAPHSVEASGQAALTQSGLDRHAETPVDGEAQAESDDRLLSGWAMLGVLGGAAVLFLLIFGRRVIAVVDRREVSWMDAWAKTVVIVVVVIVSIVIVPAKVLELGAVQDMSRAAQDLITVGLWSGALVVTLFLLWYAHRERRI